MIAPAIPHDEAARIAALDDSGLLDTGPEERFDRYTRLIRRLFDVPIALVSLVDRERQWFKSRQGLCATETPREISFCGHAINSPEVFVVEDASRDQRFDDNPLVTDDPNIRFYAGCPLATAEGYRIGTLCIIDRKPREFAQRDVETLRDMGAMVAGELAALRLATVDELTGLSNRRAFNMIAAQVLEVSRRTHQPASLLMIDLDGFKQINDTMGHAVGDAALQEYADLLQRVFRTSDLCARLGGDEFSVLMTGASARDSRAAIERFRRLVDTRNELPDRKYQLAFSSGAVTFEPARHETFRALLDEADQLMYERKRARKINRQSSA